jgi:ABC-type transport system involved in multi-copper enzyme maturation permease subunit
MDSKLMISVFGNAVESSGNAQNFSAEKILGYIQSGIAVTIFFISLFISLFSVSSVFPDMLKKGNIDLLLSKPSSRSKIFFQRYLGAMTAVSFNVFYIILFSWIILSAKFDIWNFRLIISGFVIMVFFFNIFALMAMTAMFIKNSVISLMMTYFLVFILSPIVAGVQRFGGSKDSFLRMVSGLLHGILPRVSETVMYINNLITGGELTNSVLWSSILSGLIFSGFSLFVFKKSDF